MGHLDSDSTNQPGRLSATPMRRAGAVTAAASLAVVTAAGAAALAPSTPVDPPLAAEYAQAETDGMASDDLALHAARADNVAGATSRSAGQAAAREKAKDKPEVVGVRYAAAVSGVNVRKAPKLNADTVKPLDYRDKVRITDQTRGDWRAVMINGKMRWVKGDLLSKQRPKPLPEPKPVAASSTSSSSGSSTSSSNSSSSRPSTGSCTNGTSVNGGNSNVLAVHRAVCGQFPSITSYGGYRPGGGNHSTGRAVDIMVSGSLGWQVAEYVRANAGRLGVTEVIYSQKIWTTQRSGEGWRSMSDRGSATANHYDHVHVSTL